ncbi:MAG: DUF5343 domain-containing protein [Pseudonocardiaceae bacterium]
MKPAAHSHARPQRSSKFSLKTLQILGLVDQQGMPTQQFEKLRRASTAEFKPELITMLKSVYADVFEVVEPAGATLAEIQDAFRSFTPPGQRIRMVSLFLSLLEYAEYSDSLPSVRASGGTRPAGGRLKQSQANRNGKADSRVPPPPSEAAATPLAQDAPAQEGSRAKETATNGNGDMKRMYFELLLKKADSSDTIDTDLLDRIERLVGIADNSDQD